MMIPFDKIKAKVIAGAANNQLANENIHGAILQERGILYAPDFLINAGGIINVYAELEHYGKAEIMSKTENIYNTTLEIFDFASSKQYNDTSCGFDNCSKSYRSKKNREQ